MVSSITVSECIKCNTLLDLYMYSLGSQSEYLNPHYYDTKMPTDYITLYNYKKLTNHTRTITYTLFLLV